MSYKLYFVSIRSNETGETLWAAHLAGDNIYDARREAAAMYTDDLVNHAGYPRLLQCEIIARISKAKGGVKGNAVNI
jgi:hypothetical protein